MRFDYADKDLSSVSADLVVVFTGQEKDKKDFKLVPLKSFVEVDNKLKGSLKKAIDTTGFKGKNGEIFHYFPKDSNISEWIVAIGLGEIEEVDATNFRDAVGSFTKSIIGKVKTISVQIPTKEINLSEEAAAQSFAEGIKLASYSFNKYKKERNDDKKLSHITLCTKEKTKAQNGIEKGILFSNATNLTRDLINEQPTVATPTFLADVAKDIAKKNKNIKCKIIDINEAEKMGMNAFLGIARASSGTIPPKFIHLEYDPPEKKSSKEKLALVGKGITFDSGGMNVKPGDHMQDMKIDMSGAAVVLGVFSVINDIKPDYPVIGLIASTPNLISGSSIVPGDVVKAMNGKTIEILNTDAEGRVTMADTLSYAERENATKIIDFATLTGAAVVAMGTDITALFANDKKLRDDILRSAEIAGDKMWELPLEESYKEQNKSDVADIANISNTRYGGTITAALFLQEFVGKDIKWAHLDIAGPAYLTKPTKIGPKGATGHAVRTVLNYLSI